MKKCAVLAILLLLLAIVLAIVIGLIVSFMPSSVTKPHIVFILVDDLGYADIGYLNEELHTPTMDQLAKNGVRLDSHYSQPFCTPSRAAFLSGKYPIHLGMQHNKVRALQPAGLPLETFTLADSMRAQGYSTHLVGKWDLGFFKKDYLPTRRGFDSFFGLLSARGDHYTHQVCSAGFPSPNTTQCGYDLRDNEEVAWGHTEYSTELFASKAIDVIDQHDPNKPMFLYLSFQAPHAPLQVPDEYLWPYTDIEDEKRVTFNGMVTCVDEAVKNLTQALKDAGMWENTVLAFVSDNGGSPVESGYNWPLRGAKETLWEGGIRTPSFVYSELISKAGSARSALMHISDWYPTFLRLAGATSDESLQLDGYDMWDVISSDAASQRMEILHNIDPMTPPVGDTTYPDTFNNQVRAAIRVGKWKLLTGNPDPRQGQRRPRSPNPRDRKRVQGAWWTLPGSGLADVSLNEPRYKNLWLFDIEADPNEQNDVASGNPDVVQKLLDRLAAHNVTALPVNSPANDPACSPILNGGIWTPWVFD